MRYMLAAISTIALVAASLAQAPVKRFRRVQHETADGRDRY